MDNKYSKRRMVRINGVEKPVEEWAVIYGVSLRAIRNRLYDGWGVEEAITTPVRGYVSKDNVDAGVKKPKPYVPKKPKGYEYVFVRYDSHSWEYVKREIW